MTQLYVSETPGSVYSLGHHTHWCITEWLRYSTKHYQGKATSGATKCALQTLSMCWCILNNSLSSLVSTSIAYQRPWLPCAIYLISLMCMGRCEGRVCPRRVLPYLGMVGRFRGDDPRLVPYFIPEHGLIDPFFL